MPPIQKTGNQYKIATKSTWEWAKGRTVSTRYSLQSAAFCLYSLYLADKDILGFLCGFLARPADGIRFSPMGGGCMTEKKMPKFLGGVADPVGLIQNEKLTKQHPGRESIQHAPSEALAQRDPVVLFGNLMIPFGEITFLMIVFLPVASHPSCPGWSTCID